MAKLNIQSDEVGPDTVRTHYRASSGRGAALAVKSANPDAPAVTVQAAGDLLSLRNSAGTPKMTVTAAGNVTAAGDVSVTGALAVTGAISGSVAQSGDLTVTAGNIIAATAGKGLTVKEGANARMGTGTLNGTTEVTISTTAVTATSRIFLTVQAPGGTPLGVLYVSSRSAGVSFGVKGAATDTSTFAWMIVEPAA